jgi:hypothetical protein
MSRGEAVNAANAPPRIPRQNPSAKKHAGRTSLSSACANHSPLKLVNGVPLLPLWNSKNTHASTKISQSSSEK